MPDLKNLIELLDWNDEIKFTQSFKDKIQTIFGHSTTELDRAMNKLIDEIWKKYQKNPAINKEFLFKDSRPWWKRFIQAVLKIDKDVGEKTQEFLKTIKNLAHSTQQRTLNTSNEARRKEISTIEEKERARLQTLFLLEKKKIAAEFLERAEVELKKLIIEKERLESVKATISKRGLLDRLTAGIGASIEDSEFKQQEQKIQKLYTQILQARDLIGIKGREKLKREETLDDEQKAFNEILLEKRILATKIKQGSDKRKAESEDELEKMRISYEEGKGKWFPGMRGYSTLKDIQKKEYEEKDAENKRAKWVKQVIKPKEFKKHKLKHYVRGSR